MYYADDRAKELMVENNDIVNQVVALFGPESYVAGKLNRPHIAKKAFHDSSLLIKLNELVHPAVKTDFEEWIQQHRNEKILLKEAALLVEVKSYKELDALILVIADKETRISRVLERDAHRTKEDVEKIISEQLPDSEKKEFANFIVNNNDNTSVIAQVEKIYSELIIT